MSVKIGHASINENGKVSGGKAGDQTGREICVREWYNKPWNVLIICTDKTLAKKAAQYMKAICDDDDFGYCQTHRTSGYLAIVNAGGNIAKAVPSEFDCSSLVASCYKLAGLDISVNNTTRSLRKAFLETGKFKVYTDKEHLSSDIYAEPGAVYLKEGSHVVMALEYGSKAKSSVEPTPQKPASNSKSSTPTFVVGKNYTLVSELKVRTGAGTQNPAKTHAQLTAGGKKNDKDKDGALDAGTTITCQQVKKVGNDIWIKCPSGYIAAYYNGKQYVK